LVVTARQIAVSPKNRSWVLLLLRGVLLAGLVVLLLNPVDRSETVLPPQPTSVALLVDCSQSMALGIGRSRLQRVKKTIDASARRIGNEPATRLDLFRFGNHLAKVPSLTELTATDDASQLSDALRRLPSRIAADQSRAVVLFSDGAVPHGEVLTEVAATYRQMDVPVHVFVPENDDIRGDIAITALSVPQRVTSGDQTTVRAVIGNHGFSGRRVVVSIRPADRPDATLASIPITLGDGPTPCELVVTADSALGDLVLQVPVLASEGEAVASNNSVPFRLTERERKLNVLYMEGSTGGQYRWLRDGLQEDPDIRCLSLVVDNQYARRPRLQRVGDAYRGFPSTRAELLEYDVVICSDIPRGSFTPEQIDWTVDLVSRRGGGFVMIGGHTSFGSGNWDSTAWEQLIPFDMTGRRDYLTQSFTVQIPASAESHPIWKLLDNPEENRRALNAMPRFFGTNLIRRVKPAATLLGQTNTPLSRVGIMPIFACESFGRGRTFAMSTDSTAYWGQYFQSRWGEGDNRYFCKFWRNVVRWLAENSQASQRRLIVRTDKIIYSQQQPVQITAEAFDQSLEPTSDYRLTALLTSIDDIAATNAETANAQTIELRADPILNRYVGNLPAMLPVSINDASKPMQSARLVVTAWEQDERIESKSIDLQLLNDSSEWLDPQARPEALQGIADAADGSVLSNESELTQLLQSFDETPGEVLVHRRPAWDRASLWAAFLGVLAIDWTLRRRGRRIAAEGDRRPVGRVNPNRGASLVSGTTQSPEIDV
jgi:uncharacterized membrane protein